MAKVRKKIKYELLAPAGNINKARHAIEFGADAIYLGVPDFSLRVRINQFTEKDIKETVEYAHNRGKNVYVTVNIHAHNKHLVGLPKFFRKIKKINPDGLIISDPGVIMLAKKHCPDIDIHLSTQANCTNWQAAKFWHNQGVKRIILGREVTLDEIKEIHKRVPGVELECFVHGAMCMSYSGRCMLSSYFVGRSANLGDCVQPCRWEYSVSGCNGKKAISDISITAKGHEGKSLDVEEDRHGTYMLNSKDLCLIKYLDDLKDAGIVSFKIEGRAKSIYYVSLVSRIYSEALKLKGAQKSRKLNKLYKELQTLTHRDYTTGFLFGKEKVEQRYGSSHILTNYQFVGEVKKCDSGNIFIKVHNTLLVGDNLDIIQPSGEIVKLKIKEMFDESGDGIGEAHGGQEKMVRIPSRKKIGVMSVIRKKVKN